jgi:hypothetical protein
MQNFSSESSKDNFKKLYWDGNLNHVFRHWYYIQKGLDIFNMFKYLIAAIIGVYWALHLKNPFILLTIFIICIPVLAFLGWLSVHKMTRVFQYLDMQFSSLWGTYSVKLSESQIDLLKEIRDELVKRNSKIIS